MKCPKCKQKLYYRGVMHTCEYSECKYDIDHEDFENLEERAEKAETELQRVVNINDSLGAELNNIKSKLQGITVDKLKTLINACFIIDEYENGFTEIKINDIAVKEIHKLISEVAK